MLVLTLKGKKNHYNVKLLKGYGVSISIKEHKILLKNGFDILKNQSEKEEEFVAQIPYERIVIGGKGYISNDGIKLLAEKCVNIILLD